MADLFEARAEPQGEQVEVVAGPLAVRAERLIGHHGAGGGVGGERDLEQSRRGPIRWRGAVDVGGDQGRVLELRQMVAEGEGAALGRKALRKQDPPAVVVIAAKGVAQTMLILAP